MSLRFNWLFVLALTMALFGAVPPSPAQSADLLSLLELKISLWPEYDQPSMLVIYRGQVDQTTPQPADIQLQIPASASSSLQVAYSNNGQLFDIEHTEAVNGPLMTIAFTTPNGSFQLEYYDTLDLSTPNRHYVFAATNPYLAQNLILEVQQPGGTGELTTNPVLGQAIPGPDGLNYETLLRSNVPANEPINVELSYTKTTDLLTVNNPNPEVTPEPETAQSGNSALYGALGVGVIILVVGGLIWFARPRLKSNKARTERRKSNQTKAKTAEAGQAVFCQQCGQKAKAGDEFCRKCGTKLRHSP
jgi:hypothetical protein